MDFLSPACIADSVGPATSLIGTFLSTIIAIHCNISASINWPIDFGPSALQDGLDDYDFVVVGSGSAGSVVASRLAENKKFKVLVLQAGGDPPIDSEILGLANAQLRTSVDFSYPVEHKGQGCLGLMKCIWSKGKVLGGSHSLNSGIYLRGNPRDYDTWAALGNEGWDWLSVLEFFKRTENFRPKDPSGEHGKNGPLTVEKIQIPRADGNLFLWAAKELGYPIVDDFVAGNYTGFGRVFATLTEGRRMSTAKAFLTKIRTNLHVIKSAMAVQIVFDSKKRARGVKFVYRDHYELEVNVRKEVIVSVGAIETPKLLMLSGIGPKLHLQALHIPVVQNLRVGDNLLNQVQISLFLKLDRTSKRSPEKQALDAIYDQWVHKSGPLGFAGVDITGFIDIDEDGKFPEIQFLFKPLIDLKKAVSVYDDHIASSILRQVGPYDRVIEISVVLLQPHSVGSIRLASKDYLDKPKIFPNYFDEEEDINLAIAGIQKLLEFENTKALRKEKGKFLKIDLPECDREKYKTKKYWRCYIKYLSSTLLNYAGTAKMGPKSDKTSVVNPDLKVHGVKNLRVIDASIMPKLVSANLMIPTTMIGEKGAELVNDEWR